MTMRTDMNIIRLGQCVKYALLGFLLVMAATVAFAEPPENRPPDNRPPNFGGDINVGATARSDADAAAVAIGGGGSGIAKLEVGDTTLVGGDNSLDASNSVHLDTGDTPVTVTSDDDSTYNSSHESNFFAFSTSFPQATGCFRGTQGGGGNDSGTGFLGFHWLDHNCWMSQLAAAEADAEVRALLKCHSRKFRRAIAFREPNHNKQEFCVNYMVEKHLEEIAAAQVAVENAIIAGGIRELRKREEYARPK